MFPRPSRFLRLIIFLSFVILITVSMYVLNPDASNSNTGLDYKPRQNMFTTKTASSPKVFQRGTSEISHQRTLSVQYKTSSKPKHDGDNETEFEKSVVQRIRHSQSLPLKGDEEPLVDIKSSMPEVNPHDFAYIHNPSKLCHTNHVTFLIYIHSSPVNLKKRQAVRQTWGHPKLLSLYNATMVFVLGRVLDQYVQGLVDMEAAEYGDIVQEDFVDSYRNLTHKGVAGLKWAATFCRTSEFLLKTDDDILLDIVSLMDSLYTRIIPTRQRRTKLVVCNLWTRMKVIRDTKSKWYISKEEFQEEYFPAYCSGSAFLLSADLAPALYDTALRTPFFWVDDYYVTGMLVNSLKVKHWRFNSAYLLNYNVAEEKLQNDTKELMIFHVKKLSLFLKLWPLLMLRHKGMERYLQTMTDSVRNHDNLLRNTSVNENGNSVMVEDDTRYEASFNAILRGKDSNGTFPSSFKSMQRRTG